MEACGEPAALQQEGLLNVTVRTMAGKHCKPGPFEGRQCVAQLKEGIRDCWGIPVSQQQLVLGTQILDDNTAQLFSFLGDGMEHDILCVALTRSEEEQRAFDDALLTAASAGNRAKVLDLLREEAHPNSELEGPGPLLLALALKDEGTATILRRFGAKEPSLEPKTESLSSAFAAGDLEDVVRHVHAGADPNTTLRRNQGIRATESGTALHACCAMNKKRGALEVAQVLLRCGADHTIGDSEGDTPLAHAKYFGARPMFEMLKDYGARVAGPYFAHRNGVHAGHVQGAMDEAGNPEPADVIQDWDALTGAPILWREMFLVNARLPAQGHLSDSEEEEDMSDNEGEEEGLELDDSDSDAMSGNYDEEEFQDAEDINDQQRERGVNREEGEIMPAMAVDEQ